MRRMRRSGEEPEPIDLTHLNIEASMMCLASKVRQADRKALVLPLHTISSDPALFRYPGPHRRATLDSTKYTYIPQCLSSR
jgi:hypothetical protein